MALTRLEELVARIDATLTAGTRRTLGITGCPGAGKSTLAASLCAALGPERSVLVPMDGFHLADAELRRLGRRERKGAPDTFDVDGYVALLDRVRDPDGSAVYAPEFHREIEDAVAGAIAVPPDVPLVVTEGNYLLHGQGGWERVRSRLDEVWYIELDDAIRLELLVARHVAHGKDPQAARAWSSGSDERNAELIRADRHRADLVVRAWWP